MSDHAPAKTSDQDDYAAILAAVMETERGRWFLAEFARRNRHAETERVLGAIARLEASMAGEGAAAAPLPQPVPSAAPAEPSPQPVAEAPDEEISGLSAIDTLSVDARLRMFR